MSEKKLFIAAEEGRLDRIVSRHAGESRSQVSRLIEAGAVSVDDKKVRKCGAKVQPGQRIAYAFLEKAGSRSVEVDFDVDVLYEDEFVLVVNKPAGIVVHPAPSVKEPTLVDWLRERGVSLSTISGEERQGIVHRIDRDTTGALAVAKNNEVHAALSRQLQSKSMGRYYLALIDYPLKEDCKVELPIGRNPGNRLKMAIVEGGRRARTDFVKLAEGENSTELIAAKLHTGRTHQIRVHLSRLGRHILGDEMYGYKNASGRIARVYLHACLLYFMHPVTHRPVEIAAPLHDDMRLYLDNFFDRREINEKIIPEYISSVFTDSFTDF